MMTHETAHPSDLDLAAYFEHRLAPEARAEVERHLVECDPCRAAVADAEAVTRERRRRGVFRPMLVGAVAAALAILVVSIPRDTPPGPDRLRGDPRVVTEDPPSFVAWTPASRASVRPDSLRFAWGSHPTGTVYQLTLSDEQGVLVWSERTGDTSLAFPSGMASALVAGKVYYWRVEALHPDLRTSSTRVQGFVVRSP